MRALIILPTFNEVQNLKGVVEKIINLRIEADILIIDDNSIDGTREIASGLIEKYKETALWMIDKPLNFFHFNLEMENPLCITRRITGGGAIYHHGEITYSITTTLPNPLVPLNVDESYRHLEDFIINGIWKCGAEVNYRGTSRPRAKDFYCFARPSKYDVVKKGKKLAGSAQRRSKNLFLQHGSILLNLDELDAMFSVLKLDCNIEKAKQEFRGNVTSLDEITGKNLEKHEVAMRLTGEFEKTYAVTLTEDELTPDETRMSKELIKKYSLI